MTLLPTFIREAVGPCFLRHTGRVGFVCGVVLLLMETVPTHPKIRARLKFLLNDVHGTVEEPVGCVFRRPFRSACLGLRPMVVAPDDVISGLERMAVSDLDSRIDGGRSGA